MPTIATIGKQKDQCFPFIKLELSRSVSIRSGHDMEYFHNAVGEVTVVEGFQDCTREPRTWSRLPGTTSK